MTAFKWFVATRGNGAYLMQPSILKSALPAGFADTGKLAFKRKLAKANTAQAKLAIHRVRTSATGAARVSAGAVFRLAICLGDHRFLCQNMPPNLTMGPIPTVVTKHRNDYTPYWECSQTVEHYTLNPIGLQRENRKRQEEPCHPRHQQQW